MVRKETVRVTKTTTNKTPTQSHPSQEEKFDIESFLQKLRGGLEANRKTALGFILIIIAIIQLRQFIVGIALLTVGLLLIGGFFGDKTK